MKRLLFGAATLALSTSLLTGCNEAGYTITSNTPEYDAVYNGLVIYSDACAANNLAVDPLAVGFRFAILQEEMYAAGLDFTAEGCEPDWEGLDTFDFYGVENITKRGFLFGAYTIDDDGAVADNNVEITKLNDTQYIIFYNSAGEGHTAGSIDTNYRSGKYLIETNGVKLSETSESKPWSVGIYQEDVMTFASSGASDPVVASYTMDTSIYRGSGENDDTFYFTLNCDYTYYGNESVDGYWALNSDELGSVRIEDFTTFLIADTIEQNFHFALSAEGVTLSNVMLSYEIETPVVFNYTESPYAEFGGFEIVTVLDSTAQYWPSDYTEVETLDSGYKTVTYNGSSYTS
ncbi:MAG: hypothetical protein R3Y16_03310 [Rikenellaceae bacterium]